MPLSLLLAGDALLTRPWSHWRHPGFLSLVEKVHAADVAILNLETVIRGTAGYAQANSGGLHLTSPPAIAEELAWAGFGLVAHANNHSFDYGSEGVLETIDHLERAGIGVAGSGADLQAARRPRFHRTPNGVVALVAMASTFVSYGRASPSRPDGPGRPGLNPLGLNRGLRPYRGDPRHVLEGRSIAPADLAPNLAAIREASQQANVVAVSLHAHLHGEWLDGFIDAAIDAGAGTIFVHGPHRVGAIEIRKGVPVLHSLGSIAFEIEQVSVFPPETYVSAGLDPLASRADLADRPNSPLRHYRGDRDAYRGLAVQLHFDDRRLKGVRLIPLDLWGSDDEERGRPKVATPDAAILIVDEVRRLSERYGSKIDFEKSGCGYVRL